MNEHRDLLERELQRMLTVDPSPDLQARIRTHAFATREPRMPWFALASGLAGVAATIALMLTYNHANTTEIPLNVREVATKAVTPTPAVPAEVKVQTPELRSRRRQERRKPPLKQPVLVLATTTTDTGLEPVRMELPPLRSPELANSLQPIPKPVFSIAILQPIDIEPLDLTVRHLGVNE